MAKFLGTTGLQRLVQWVKNYAKITVNNNVSTITIGDNSITPLTEHQDISGKANKSEMSVTTSGDETTITLKSGTSATVINAHQSLDGKQDKIDSSHKLSADLISDGTTNKAYTATEKTKLAGIAEGAEANVQSDWNQTTTTADDYIKNKPSIPTATTTSPKMNGTAAVGSETKWAKGDHVHPSDTTKADKVSNATANNLAALDANGNLIDSGVSATSAGTDTKNTTGSTADSAKLYIVGAKEQSANPVTYSQANAYVTAGKVYSNAKEVVNLSDTQALTNKTYNGYTLAAACAKAVDTSIASGSTSTNVPTSQAVANAIAAAQVGAAAFQGTAPTTFAPTNYKKGYYWVVATAGTYAGETCEPGDMIFCVEDYSSAYSTSDFSVVQNNVIEMTTADVDAAIAAADE